MPGELRGGRRPRIGVESLERRALLSALPPGFQETVWARGFDTPTAQAFAPDGRLFVTEKAGDVRVVQRDGTLLSTPFLSLNPETTQDRGLVGLALDPKFNANGYVYLWWTKSDAGGTRNRLSRFTRSAANPNAADPNSEVVLVESPHTTNVHTGGAMGFGADGMLYLGVGDGGIATAAQDLNDLRGKVLRLNVADPAHLVPSDNPFVGQSGKRAEIWAYGFRNPFTGAMKPWTNMFFVNDVGEEHREEVNKVQRGGNFGWPVVEGKTTTAGFVNPLYAYAHAGLPTGSAAVTGGVFYSGTQFPLEYRGDYFFGDYINRFTRRLDTGGTGTNAPSDFGADTDAALDYDVGPDGSLYYLSAFGFGFNGENRPVYKITWVGTDANRPPVAVAAATGPTSGLPPLAVHFTAAGSSDPDGDALSYRWDFGDQATGTGATAAHTYAAAGTYHVTLTVDDGRGGTNTSAPITVTVGNRAPTPAITAPAVGAKYAATNTITFAGSATDPEDGALPASAFSWTVLLLHNDHQHTVTTLTGVTSGSFTVPTSGHVDANQSYRVVLTVTDSGGLSTQTTRDVAPRVANVSLATSPAGLTVALDGTPRTADPVPSLVGAARVLSAAATQVVNGVTYEFVSWSDGGAATHAITVPTADATYVATYRPADGSTPATPVAFAATADTFVQDGASAGRNFGTWAEMDVKRGSYAGQNREALLTFDTASLPGAIASARLRVFGRLSDGAAAAGVATDVYGASTSWQEKAVTWNSRPAGGAKLSSVTVSPGASGKWYEIDLTAYVSAERSAGRKSIGLLLRNPDNSSPYVIFNAREAKTNRPELVLTPQGGTTPPPPPPPPPPAQSPFGGTPIAVPGTIQAEHFDDGGEGVAYHDSDAVNEPGAYRGTGVDVEASGDTGGGFDVGYLKAGEWVEYTVNVAAAGNYDLAVRVAADAGYGGTFHLEVDGADHTGPIALPATGGWQTWQTVTRPAVALPAGRHVLRLAIDVANSGGDVGNINWFKFSAAAAAPVGTIKWSAPRKAAPIARDEAQGVGVNGKLYVFGGFTGDDFLATRRVDVYDPVANAWTTRRDMPEAVTHTTAVFDGTYVWLVGGYVGNNPGPGTNHVWKYNPASDTWARGPDLPAARGAGAGALLGRELHFFGGLNQSRTSEQAEHWVLNADDPGATWAARAPLPVPHNHLGAAALGGKVYAIGGQTGEVTDAVDSAQVWAYTPATNTWARLADLLAPRSHVNAATFVRNGRIVVAGGESQHNGPESDVWEFNPATNRWTTLTLLPAPRRAAVVQWVANRIIVTGGYDGFDRAPDDDVGGDMRRRGTAEREGEAPAEPWYSRKPRLGGSLARLALPAPWNAYALPGPPRRSNSHP